MKQNVECGIKRYEWKEKVKIYSQSVNECLFPQYTRLRTDFEVEVPSLMMTKKLVTAVFIGSPWGNNELGIRDVTTPDLRYIEEGAMIHHQQYQITKQLEMFNCSDVRDFIKALKVGADYLYSFEGRIDSLFGEEVLRENEKSLMTFNSFTIKCVNRPFKNFKIVCSPLHPSQFQYFPSYSPIDCESA